MKIAGIIGKKSTAERLESTRARLAECHAKIAQLESERGELLLADEIDKLRARSEALAIEKGVAADLADRIAALELRRAEEQDEQRQRDLKAAIDRLETTLPQRQRAAATFEAALLNLVNAARELDKVSNSTIQNWPAGLPRDGFYRLSTERAGRLIAECFGASALVHPYTRAHQSSAEFFHRTLDGAKRVAGFAEGENEHHRKLIEGLREPEPADEFDIAAEAQGVA